MNTWEWQSLFYFTSESTHRAKKHAQWARVFFVIYLNLLYILYIYITKGTYIREWSILKVTVQIQLTFPREASISFRSSLSINPSLFWSIMLKASLNSWIWSWSNIANTLEVARWARFFVPALLWVFLLAILAAGWGGKGSKPIRNISDFKDVNLW